MTVAVAALVASAALVGSSLPSSEPLDPVRSRTVCTVTDPRIDEASGLVDLGRDMVVANDSGDGPVLYVLDRGCRVVGTTTYAGRGAARDVEALAPAGSHTVWVGDVGDNARGRDEVVVRRVPVGRGQRRVMAPSYRLVYPDGPHDAETLLVQPTTERLFVVTKQPLRAQVFAAPARLIAGGANVLREVASVSILATDGSFLPDGRRVLLRGYPSATLYSFPGWAPLRTYRLPEQPQGESLSVGPGGRVRIGSEGLGQPVLQLGLPAGMRTASPVPRAQPASDRPAVDRLPGWAATLLWAGPVMVVAALLGWPVVRRRLHQRGD